LAERIGEAANAGGNAENLGAMALEEPAPNECPELEQDETSSVQHSAL
jgi:hypothetical protein